MRIAWDRIVKGREFGLCEIIDDPVPWTEGVKEEIRCDIIEG
jgi:hypothetical protein